MFVNPGNPASVAEGKRQSPEWSFEMVMMRKKGGADFDRGGQKKTAAQIIRCVTVF